MIQGTNTLSRANLLVEREIFGRAHAFLYEIAHALCLRHKIEADIPHAGLFFAVRGNLDRQPILSLDRKVTQACESNPGSLPYLRLSTASLLIATQDTEAAHAHYHALSHAEVAPEVRRETLEAIRALALIEGDWAQALATERILSTHFRDHAILPPSSFTVQAVLGAGVTGSTWLALETATNLKRVIKVGIPNQGEQPAFLDFCNSMMAQQYEHPSLERILRLEPGPLGSLLRISRFKPGTTLEDWVEANGPMPWQEWLGVIWSLVEGLLTVHQKGIVHRAIRPGHLVLRLCGAPGSPCRWTSFLHGADQVPPRTLLHALISQPELVRKTALGASAARYATSMPPEILGKQRAPTWHGPIQDVYGLGILTAFALTGKTSPAHSDWEKESIPAIWRDLATRASSWSQAHRMKHLLEVREILGKIAGDDWRAMIHSHETEQARLACEEALAENPLDSASLADLAELMSQAGRHAEAESRWSQCLDLNPDRLPALTGRAFARLAQGKETEAEQDLRQAALAHPGMVEPTALLVRFLGGKNRYQEILHLTEDALTHHPKDFVLRMERGKAFLDAGIPQSALPEFLHASGQQATNPHVWSMIARCQFVLGENGKALVAWSRALGESTLLSTKERAQFLMERASVYEQADCLKEALADAEEAVVLHDGIWNRMNRVRLLAKAAQFQKAEEEQRTILGEMAGSTKPIPGSAVILWADLLNDLNRHDEHNSLISKVIAASRESVLLEIPGNPSGRTSHEITLSTETENTLIQPDPASGLIESGPIDVLNARMRRGLSTLRESEASGLVLPKARIKQAIGDFRFNLDNGIVVGQKIQAALGLGRLHTQLNSHSLAAQAFTHALNHDSRSLPGLLGRASAHLQSGLATQAQVDACAAHEIAPENRKARLLLAQTLEKLDLRAEVASKTMSWLDSDPLDRHLREFRAEFLRRQGRWEEALKEFLALEKQCPQDPAIECGLAWVYLELKQPGLALEILHHAKEPPLLERDDTSVQKTLMQVEALLQLGRNNEAFTCLDEFSNPCQPTSHEVILRSRIQKALGKKRVSKALLKVATEMAPGEWPVLHHAWREALDSGNAKHCLDSGNLLLELVPHYLPVQATRIACLAHLENWESALLESKTLAEDAPDESWVLETRARILASAPEKSGGDRLMAVGLASQAWEKHNRSRVRPGITLAICLGCSGKPEKALQIAKSTLALCTDSQKFEKEILTSLISRLALPDRLFWKGSQWKLWTAA